MEKPIQKCEEHHLPGCDCPQTVTEETTMSECEAKFLGAVDMFLIVGKCPQCGAPIYGKGMISDKETPTCKYSCECNQKVKTPPTSNTFHNTKE